MFSDEEATDALRAYCLTSGRRFPVRSSAFQIDGGSRPFVRIAAPMTADGTDLSISFSNAELIEPLLLFCKRKRIPLPARGAKEITTVNNCLTLIIKIK